MSEIAREELHADRKILEDAVVDMTAMEKNLGESRYSRV